MGDVFIIGSFSTDFGRWISKDHRALAREAVHGALGDAGLGDGLAVGQAYFGNCLLHVSGQTMIRGQVCLSPLMDEGVLPERLPIANVEGACATGSMALHLAWKDVLSGQTDIALAVGVEKLYDPSAPGQMLKEIGGGFDRFDQERWLNEYRDLAERSGAVWAPSPDRSIAMDTYGVQASYHMHRYGTTREQIAIAAAKNHVHGSLNPKAQYRFRMTTDEVLADRPVSGPLTRAMCAPIGDGAAAAIVCSEERLRKLPPQVAARAIRIRASAISGGKHRAPDEPSLSRVAGDRAYDMAGVGPEDIDLAEVHDATSFCEVYQMEMLRFCAEGEGGRFVESGATALGGRLPVNTSGGLVSKGHPIAATGLSMVSEIVGQLRREAGARQVEGANIGLIENGGGVIGLEEAVCAVTILEGSASKN
ncbi:thiolase family protein [Bradyrhizobium sp. Ash2021]|uniref:thiolase family protein n=1 Tax=Bradyrhizobium sp. Ash2021 TaxID=2954771 RepID=UPI0028161EB1|nr:thiolase family protein [Bradyrhizobium sp. Ash2021]WMT73471.1 thiolase family protein [Bradyrhizobium sp. Ash2021]